MLYFHFANNFIYSIALSTNSKLMMDLRTVMATKPWHSWHTASAKIDIRPFFNVDNNETNIIFCKCP